LNTWLVILTLLYIKPRDFFRKLKKKGFKRFITEDVIGSNDSPQKKAVSIALGIFIGITPLWGIQTVTVIFLALIFKLNKTIAFAFSNISLPPFIPFIIFTSFQLGNFILGENVTFHITEIVADFEVLKHLKSYIIGSLALASLTAIFIGILSYLLFLFFENKNVTPTNV
jgi:uncharacterized protein (DUF2062 family)